MNIVKTQTLDTSSPTHLSSDASRPDVVTKYRTVANLTNEVLQLVIDQCLPGADVYTLCCLGDRLIEEKLEKVYTKKENNEKIRKGHAFPTCITVNELIDHFSPLESESRKLQKGDLVKVHLGAHIHGYSTLVSHSLVIGETEIVGRKADALCAAWTAAQIALRTIAVGAQSTALIDAVKRCVAEFKCNVVEGTACTQLKRHVIDGVKSFPIIPVGDEKITSVEFELYDVYALQVTVSTGEGKPKPSDKRTCVYRRNVEQNYTLKTPISRQFFREIMSRFPTLPFAARAVTDEKVCCLGISECFRHELLEAYPVLTERQGEYVAQFQFTVMLLPGGVKQVTGLPFTQQHYTKSTFSVTDPALVALLSKSMNTKKQKRKKKVNSSQPESTERDPVATDSA